MFMMMKQTCVRVMTRGQRTIRETFMSVNESESEEYWLMTFDRHQRAVVFVNSANHQVTGN